MSDKYPQQPEWMAKYMKSGKELEKQLQDTVIDNAAQWTPGDIGYLGNHGWPENLE